MANDSAGGGNSRTTGGRSVLVIGDSMSIAHVARAMVVARRLQEEGHRVEFATGAVHQELARQEGFEPHEIDCVRPEAALAAIRRGSHIFDYDTVRRYVDSDLSLIGHVNPELIIGDFRLSLNISAELAGVEHWSIVSGYMTRYYSAPETPPETFPIVRLLGQRVSRLLFPLLKRQTLRAFARQFNRYRRKLGLRPIRDVFDAIASRHRNLIADLPEYAPCADLPREFEYVGPLLWEPRVNTPEWLDRLDPERPTVYVTMGSTGAERDFERVLSLLRGDWQVMTTTGRHVHAAPAGVYAVPYARGSELLRRSDAVVCHGGSLTVYQAVSEGVPVVGIPTFHDQELNLDRVEALTWGVQLRPGAWRGKDLCAALERVRQPDIQAGVSRGREQIRRAINESESRRLVP